MRTLQVRLIVISLLVVLVAGCSAIPRGSMARACASPTATATETNLEGSWIGRIEGRNDLFAPGTEAHMFERWRYLYVRKDDGGYHGVATFYIDPGEFPLQIEERDGRLHIEYTESHKNSAIRRILDLEKSGGRLRGHIRSYGTSTPMIDWKGAAEFCKMSDNYLLASGS